MRRCAGVGGVAHRPWFRVRQHRPARPGGVFPRSRFLVREHRRSELAASSNGRGSWCPGAGVPGLAASFVERGFWWGRSGECELAASSNGRGSWCQSEGEAELASSSPVPDAAVPARRRPRWSVARQVRPGRPTDLRSRGGLDSWTGDAKGRLLCEARTVLPGGSHEARRRRCLVARLLSTERLAKTGRPGRKRPPVWSPSVWPNTFEPEDGRESRERRRQEARGCVGLRRGAGGRERRLGKAPSSASGC